MWWEKLFLVTSLSWVLQFVQVLSSFHLPPFTETITCSISACFFLFLHPVTSTLSSSDNYHKEKCSMFSSRTLMHQANVLLSFESNGSMLSPSWPTIRTFVTSFSPNFFIFIESCGFSLFLQLQGLRKVPCFYIRTSCQIGSVLVFLDHCSWLVTSFQINIASH